MDDSRIGEFRNILADLDMQIKVVITLKSLLNLYRDAREYP